MGSGYLPPALRVEGQTLSLESALLLLACHALGRELPPEDARRLSIEEIPGVKEAVENVRHYKGWTVHGERYHQAEILKHFRLQCWTVKPAFVPWEYEPHVELGRYLNPMFERK